MNKELHWDFPLARTHTGIVMGNGIQGIIVWGEATLKLTVARSGFWDHRGGIMCRPRGEGNPGPRTE